MRVSKLQHAKNRQQVIAAPAKLLLERGIEGVGVDALAKAADRQAQQIGLAHQPALIMVVGPWLQAHVKPADGPRPRTDPIAPACQVRLDQILPARLPQISGTVDGAFADRLAVFEGMRPRERVEVLLLMLGSCRHVQLPKSGIRLV
jgi:hypothetical protein